MQTLFVSSSGLNVSKSVKSSLCRKHAREQKSKAAHWIREHSLRRSMVMSLPSRTRKRPIASRIAGVAVKLLIHSMCTVARDVEVDINVSSNMALFLGRLNAVTIKASSILYNGISVSGGIALYTDEIMIKSADGKSSAAVASFSKPPGLAKPFSVSVRATFTEADLNRTGPLRDAMQILLEQIVSTSLSGAIGRNVPEHIGGLTPHLDHIQLLDVADEKRPFWFPLWPFRRSHSSSWSKQGTMLMNAYVVLPTGKRFDFSVRSGVSIVDDGSVVKLADPHLIWNGVSVPLVTIDMIGIKLGARTKITKIHIERGRLSADGITVISPPIVHSRQLPSTAKR